jgi:hypothetical protein
VGNDAVARRPDDASMSSGRAAVRAVGGRGNSARSADGDMGDDDRVRLPGIWIACASGGRVSLPMGSGAGNTEERAPRDRAEERGGARRRRRSCGGSK